MNKIIHRISRRMRLLEKILQSQKSGTEYAEAASLITYIKKHKIRFYTASRRSKGNYCFIFGADWPKEYDKIAIRGGGIVW